MWEYYKSKKFDLLENWANLALGLLLNSKLYNANEILLLSPKNDQKAKIYNISQECVAVTIHNCPWDNHI